MTLFGLTRGTLGGLAIAAVGGAFLALLWPRLANPRNRIIALCAAAVALGVVPITTAGVPVLVAGGVALLAGLLTPPATKTTEQSPR